MNLEEFICDICKNDYIKMFTSDNIVGIGLGNKVMNGVETDLSCMHVYVKEKLPESAVAQSIMIPKTHCGVFTDVIECGDIKPLTFDQTVRPLQGGYAIGREFWGGIGTYGGPMEKGNATNLKKYALSNNHVLGGVNTNFKFNVAYQTAYAFDPNPANRIGEVVKYIPIQPETFPMSGTPSNKVDCGLAVGYDKSIFANIIKNVGEIKDLGIPKLGMKVVKSGRTTETTRGVISTLGGTIRLNLPGSSFFVDQIICTISSAAGDSGSLLFEDGTNKLLGLLFAGGGSIVMFNDIRNVLSLLGIRPPIKNWRVN
ncbi:MAG: hypothetical protein ACRC28_18105 [Clostridium sp.]|uniref:hypothetical protein n=1 Tax=Clostridium sp. TaxID=1506 RepID=UPI003F3C00E5